MIGRAHNPQRFLFAVIIYHIIHDVKMISAVSVRNKCVVPSLRDTMISSQRERQTVHRPLGGSLYCQPGSCRL